MKNKYQRTFDKIHLSEQSKNKLLKLIDKEQESMKISWRKSAAAVICCVLCAGITVFAAARLIFNDSSARPDTLTADYAAVEQAQQETGLKFNCPKVLGKDYSFMNMNINDGEYFDENGESLGTYSAVFISYLDTNKNALIYEVRPENSIEREQTASDPQTAEVSPGYYAETEEQGMEQTLIRKSLVWYADGNRYELSGYNLLLESEDIAAMAKEIMESDN